MDLRREIENIVAKIVEAEQLGGGFRLYHRHHAVDDLLALLQPRATPAPTSRPLADHAYLSAGDNPHASGDRAYRGCSLEQSGQICGRPRSQHPARPGSR